jgi:small nuclear ribonucleoprotein (snRNP)-like protein
MSRLIRIEDSTYEVLVRLKGKLTELEGKNQSMDDVINFLLMNCRIRPEFYPDWPLKPKA